MEGGDDPDPGPDGAGETGPSLAVSRRRRLVDNAALVVVAVVVAVVVRTFVAQAYYIPSASMEPTLRIDDRVVVSRLAYDLHRPHRGDIVVFRSPPGVDPAAAAPKGLAGVLHDVGVAVGVSQDQTVLIKRVVGLPGDSVSGAGGHVYIDGRRLVEPYLPSGTVTSTFGPVRVPPGDVFVMGDNRTDSLDSRFFGAIPERTIVGRAIWRAWPAWKAAFL